MNTIKISNLDTKYTIDTYNIFGIEDEMAMNELEGDYDDYNWDYDMRWYVKHLAELATNYINELLDEKIMTIKLVDTYSPAYYNYSTDNCSREITYDEKKLDEYINKYIDDYENYDKWDYEEINKVCFYLDSLYNEDDYVMSMFENREEYNYYTYTKN